MRKINLPLSKEVAASLSCGEAVLLNGVMYTARDAAHKKLVALLEAGHPLPFEPEGAVIYYCGPTPAPAGFAIGAAGPTTSYRMDAYTPALYAAGVRGSIGKGQRNAAVREAIQNYGAVYFGATGGAGALLSACIKKAEVIAFPELGTEAVHRLEVIDFPVLVINAPAGGDLYAEPDLSVLLM